MVALVIVVLEVAVMIGMVAPEAVAMTTVKTKTRCQSRKSGVRDKVCDIRVLMLKL